MTLLVTFGVLSVLSFLICLVLVGPLVFRLYASVFKGILAMTKGDFDAPFDLIDSVLEGTLKSKKRIIGGIVANVLAVVFFKLFAITAIVLILLAIF